MADVKSAVAFHLETFGAEGLDSEDPALEVFVGEAVIAGGFKAQLTLEPGATTINKENLQPDLAPGGVVSGGYSGQVDFNAFQAANDLYGSADEQSNVIGEIEETNN